MCSSHVSFVPYFSDSLLHEMLVPHCWLMDCWREQEPVGVHRCQQGEPCSVCALWHGMSLCWLRPERKCSYLAAAAWMLGAWMLRDISCCCAHMDENGCGFRFSHSFFFIALRSPMRIPGGRPCGLELLSCSHSYSKDFYTPNMELGVCFVANMVLDGDFRPLSLLVWSVRQSRSPNVLCSSKLYI